VDGAGAHGGEDGEIKFEDLGLDSSRQYLVFEFWQKKLVGQFSTTFPPGPLPRPFNSQVFVIREQLARPQLVATDRHITGGAVDLVDVQWRDGEITGRSRVVGGDPYRIFLTEPDGWRLEAVECDGGSKLPVVREGGMAVSGCRADTSLEIGWRARYRQTATGRPTTSASPPVYPLPRRDPRCEAAAGARCIFSRIARGHRLLLPQVVHAGAIGVRTVAVGVGIEAPEAEERQVYLEVARLPVRHRADVPVAAEPARDEDVLADAALSTFVSSQTVGTAARNARLSGS